MSNPMRQMKATAEAHLKRDLSAARKWICTCEDCREMRALTGMDKLLGVWPLVRQIQDLEQRLEDTPAGPEKHALQQQYATLQDQLAETMAR